MEKTLTTHHIQHIRQGRSDDVDSPVITETRLTLSINGKEWVDFLCSPVDQFDLCSGFLFTNGVIQNINEITSLDLVHCDTLADIWLSHPADPPEKWQRNSGCSGGVSNPAVKLYPLTEPEKFSISQDAITELLRTFYSKQTLYRESGGVHSSALCDCTKILMLAEDIGRHNTLDKLAGHLLREPAQTDERIIITTGRISLEMMQKAAQMRAGWVISRTSPTSASIDLAEDLGMGVIGYARTDECTIYCGADRFFRN